MIDMRSCNSHKNISSDNEPSINQVNKSVTLQNAVVKIAKFLLIYYLGGPSGQILTFTKEGEK